MKSFGLNNDIIQHAKSLVTKDDFDFETILKKIHDDKVIIENEKELILINSNKQKALTLKLDEANQELKEKSGEYIAKAKQEARDILLQAKEDANNIIKEMESLSSSTDLNNLRNNLNSKIKNLNNDKNTKEIPNTNNSKQINPTTIFVGQNVFVKSYEKEGTICTLPSKSNTVLVMIGSMKLKVNISELEISKQTQNDIKKEKTLSSFNSFSKSKNIKSEVNVIGLDSVSAIEVVDKFLDDATLSSLNFARIVHGKGSGILRKAIHEFLKSHKAIKSFRLGNYGEGEAGVTVVEFKS